MPPSITLVTNPLDISTSTDENQNNKLFINVQQQEKACKENPKCKQENNITKRKVKFPEETEPGGKGEHEPDTEQKENSERNAAMQPEEKTHHKEMYHNYLFGPTPTPLKWVNIISIAIVHGMALITFITFPYPTHLGTLFTEICFGLLSGFGVTGGAHRLWCHKTYKAKLPLRILLAICYSIAGQNTLHEWVRDHRVHHKFTETDADPHNSNRGFFFAHVGWLMMRKHPDVINKGKQVDCSDLRQDPVVVFFEKYFTPLKIFWCFFLPTFIPWYVWKESLGWSFMACIARYVWCLNSTWLVNSAAHIWGNRPFNRNIQPVENRIVSAIALGEGWHNYHHTFPWDYKAAELGTPTNLTTILLNFFAKIGWAYDLRSPSEKMIRKVILAKGDGTYSKLEKKVSASEYLDHPH